METRVTDLLISDALLIELRGWSEIKVKDWSGGFRPSQEQQNIWLHN